MRSARRTRVLRRLFQCPDPTTGVVRHDGRRAALTVALAKPGPHRECQAPRPMGGRCRRWLKPDVARCPEHTGTDHASRCAADVKYRGAVTRCAAWPLT